MSTSGLENAPATTSASSVAQSLANPAVLASVVLLGFSYSFNAMDRLVFPALLVPIKKAYGLTLAESGFLAWSFAIFIVLFGAFAGSVMVKVGRKATLVGGLVAFSLFTMLTPLASGFYDMAIYRSLTGAGEAFQIAALWAIVGAYFGARRGASMGLLNAFFGFGAFLGPTIGTRLAAGFGSWQLPFYGLGIAGIVMAVILVIFVPRSFTSAVDQEVVAGVTDSKAETGGLFNRNSVLLAIAFALTGWSVAAFQSLYPTYLRTELGFSLVNAGTAFSMYGVGGMLAVFGGRLGDKLRRTGHLSALALLTIDGFLLFHGHWPFVIDAGLALITGALVSGYLYPRFVAVVQRCVPSGYVGHAMSLLIPCYYVPGLLSGPSTGWLVSRFGWGTASLFSAVLPPALALLLSWFYDPRHVRGESAVSGAHA